MKQHSGDDLALYRVIYGVLVALTLVTVTASALGGGNGRGFAITVALVIAAAKAALIGLYFMHLKDERPLVLGIVATGLVAIAILAIGILPDIALRAGQ